MPWSRPSSTPRVIALEPKRSRTLVERRVERERSSCVERQRRAGRRASSSRFATAMPDERQALALDQRHRRRQQAARGGEDRPRVRRSRAAACASASRARSRRSAAAARPCGRPGARARMRRVDAVDERDERRVDRRRATCGDRGRARAASRSSAAGGRPAPAAGRGCGRARGGAAPTPGPSSATSAASASRATSPTVAIPRACSLPAVTGPTPQSRSTGSGWRNASSPSGGTTSSPSGFATPLATLARNFVRATPTVIGRPTRSRTSRRSRTAISAGVPGDPLHARARRGTPRRSTCPSTSGVVSSKTRNIALLASV